MTNSEILPAAEVEYGQAIDWYLAKSAAVAKRFVVAVETSIDSIRNDPEQYPRWDQTYRFCLVSRFPYFVAYRHTSELVVIVAIRHASRDQDAWKQR